MKVAATVTATLFLFTSFISFLPEKARGAEFILDLYPVADALVYSGEESTNYGSMSSLEVAYSTTTTHGRYSFVRFDISSIPANATIVSARFRSCLLYTSDAADDLLCVDLGGRPLIKKKTKNK